MKPDTYVEQDSCATCEHVFEVYDYDGDDEYYCSYGASKRPPCGSLLMEEDFQQDYALDRDARRRNARSFYRKWRDWSKDREVKSWGCCQKYRRKKEGDNE